MDRSQWIRDPGKVHKALAVQPDGSVLAIRDVNIYIPNRFVEKSLAKITGEVQTLAIFAIVVDNKHYAVSTVNSMIRLSPSTISTVKFDGDSYLELNFPAGSVVIIDTLLPRRDSLVYRVFNEMIEKGRIPWYLNYNDVVNLFDTSKEYANVDFTRVHYILEMVAAVIARDPKQLTRQYRNSMPPGSAPPETPPAFVPLRSITYGTTNTTSRLMGSYFAEGLTSALVNPSERNEAIEDMLRQ